MSLCYAGKLIIDCEAQELGIDNIEQNTSDESKDNHGYAPDEDGGKRADPLMLRCFLSAVERTFAAVLQNYVNANDAKDTDGWIGECQHNVLADVD